MGQFAGSACCSMRVPRPADLARTRAHVQAYVHPYMNLGSVTARPPIRPFGSRDQSAARALLEHKQLQQKQTSVPPASEILGHAFRNLISPRGSPRSVTSAA